MIRIFIFLLMGPTALFAADVDLASHDQLASQCEKDLASFPGPMTITLVKSACAKVTQLPDCVSVEGRAIYHYDKTASSPKAASKRVLVFSLIHGDERPAGTVGRYWMERLETLYPNNTWRVVPVLNPDGVLKKTRTNAHRIDVNRNFPTKDWAEAAVKTWKTQLKSNPRRNPGLEAGSEPETKCALKQIEDFKPDFIVSVHTPLRVLDFDGPHVKPPSFDYLPWKSLGHYPGSLGRYMWFERQTPVLTTELEERLPKDYRPLDRLQDIVGKLAGLEDPSKKRTSSLIVPPQ